MNNNANGQQVVVDTKNFKGNVEAILSDGISLYTNQSRQQFIDEGFSIMSWDEYGVLINDYIDSLCGNWKEITEEEFDDYLNCLPPLKWYDGGFFISEMYMADSSTFCQKFGGRFYTSLQRLSTGRPNILESLREYVEGYKDYVQS